MDNRLSDALAFSNYRLTLQVQRQNIEVRTAAAQLLSYQGAIFKATPEIIALASYKVYNSGPLLVDDQSGNVVRIENPGQFLELLVEKYDSAMTLKLNEQQKLKLARSTAKIVGL